MKKSIFFSSLLATALLFSMGCTKSQTHKDDLDKTINDIIEKAKLDNQQTDDLIANINKTFTMGGQPGSITLNGVIVLDADKLDSRITTSLEAGLTRAGSATEITKKDLLVLNNLEANNLAKLNDQLKKTETKKTYINLGCELAESEIAGLTEVSAKEEMTKDIISLSASRVFICGEQKLNKLVAMISASEVMLKDANLINQKEVGSLTLSTSTLVLVGKNKISGLGENKADILLPGSSLDLKVTTEIYGDGELALQTKGGDNIKSTESK